MTGLLRRFDDVANGVSFGKYLYGSKIPTVAVVDQGLRLVELQLL